MRVLLIADLEGIAHVDQATALCIGGEGNEAAIEAMTRATLEVVTALEREGVDQIRVSDAHRSGAPHNLDPARFPSCEVHFTDDMYGGPLLDGVDAVCAVGMHARAKANGFAGHTVSLHTEWTLGSAHLDESRLAQLLAAERGIPMWFTCGDDVLANDVKGVLPCAVTKQSTSATQTKSLDDATVSAALKRVMAERNTRLPPVPCAPLTITFQHRAEADVAVAAGAKRAGSTSVVIAPKKTFFEQYTEALAVIATTEETLLNHFTTMPGSAAFARQLADLLAAPWED